MCAATILHTLGYEGLTICSCHYRPLGISDKYAKKNEWIWMDGQLRAPALNQTPSTLYTLFFPSEALGCFQKELHKFMKLVSVLQIIVRKLRRAHVSMETPPAQLRAESQRWFGLSAVTEP